VYPEGARRLGHILETYIEPVWLIKAREWIFSQEWFWLVILFVGWRFGSQIKFKAREKVGWLKKLFWPIVALLIFSWKLASVPPAIYVDEAVTGYSAYSVLMTGKDEYGKTVPILFKYFGSWLPGLNMYYLVPWIKVFGLTEWGVRIPAVLLGVWLILVFYAVVKLKTKSEKAAFWGAGFLIVVPWMVFNARLAYEEMIGMILWTAGCGLLGRSVVKKEYLKWGILALSLSTYTAHVFRYLTVIIIPVWAVIHVKEVWNWPKKVWWQAAGIFFSTQLFNLMVINTPAFWVKQVIYEGVSLLKIWQNFWGQITTYLSPVTLFVKNPDIDMQHQIPQSGLFSWWMVWPISAGLWGWITKWRENKWWLAIMIVSIVPAALSGEFISVQRALPLLIPLSMVMAEGLSSVRKPILIGLWLYSAILVGRSYFVLLPGINQEAWNFGYKQLAEETVKYPQTTFIVDNGRNTRNYILPLFYLAYSPTKLQTEVETNTLSNYYFSGKTFDDHKYGNMEFRAIEWKADPCKDQILVGDELSISKNQAMEHKLTLAGEVRNKQGKLLLQWWKTNPKEKCSKMLL